MRCNLGEDLSEMVKMGGGRLQGRWARAKGVGVVPGGADARLKDETGEDESCFPLFHPPSGIKKWDPEDFLMD